MYITDLCQLSMESSHSPWRKEKKSLSNDCSSASMIFVTWRSDDLHNNFVLNGFR